MFKKDKESTGRFKPLKVLSIILVFAAIAATLSTLVMYLWNAILPDVIGVKPLTFWKAMGLLLLAKILFGGIGKLIGGKKHTKKRHWRNKWMNMSHEERKEAKLRWKEHCSRRNKSKHEE